MARASLSGSIFEFPSDDEDSANLKPTTEDHHQRSESGTLPVVELSEEDFRVRKEKRMQSNRESARRSRMKKKAHYDDTTQLLEQLREENGLLRYKVSLAVQNYQELLHRNHELRMHALNLSHRLQYLDLAYSTQQPSVSADHVAADFEDWLLR